MSTEKRAAKTGHVVLTGHVFPAEASRPRLLPAATGPARCWMATFRATLTTRSTRRCSRCDAQRLKARECHSIRRTPLLPHALADPSPQDKVRTEAYRDFMYKNQRLMKDKVRCGRLAVRRLLLRRLLLRLCASHTRPLSAPLGCARRWLRHWHSVHVCGQSGRQAGLSS